MRNFLLLALLLLVQPALAIVEEIRVPVPILEGTTYTGEMVRLVDFIGQPVVLHFWATWERQSYTDALLLQELQTAYDVPVLGINHFDLDDDAQQFIDLINIGYPMLPDPEGEIAMAFDVDEIPHTFIIDGRGNIIENLTQPITNKMLLDALNISIADPEIIEAPVPPDAEPRYTAIRHTITEEGYPQLGEPDGEATLELFMNFDCTRCRRFFEQTYLPVIERVASGEASYIFMPLHEDEETPGLRATKAALCAGEQGQFWIYHDMLFDWAARYDSIAFTDARLRQGALNMGLDIGAWDNCLASERPAEILDASAEAFNNRNYSRIPAAVINGDRVPAIRSAIDDVLDDLIGNRI